MKRVAIALVVFLAGGVCGGFAVKFAMERRLGDVTIERFGPTSKVPGDRVIVRWQGEKLVDTEYDGNKWMGMVVWTPDSEWKYTHLEQGSGKNRMIATRYVSHDAAQRQDPSDILELYSTAELPMFQQQIVMKPQRVVRRANVSWLDQ